MWMLWVKQKQWSTPQYYLKKQATERLSHSKHPTSGTSAAATSIAKHRNEKMKANPPKITDLTRNNRPELFLYGIRK